MKRKWYTTEDKIRFPVAGERQFRIKLNGNDKPGIAIQMRLAAPFQNQWADVTWPGLGFEFKIYRPFIGA